MADQPMLGLALAPTIAMRRGQAYVAACQSCGSLMAISEAIGTRPLTQLGACPGCGANRWSSQDVPVGPFSSSWAFHLVHAATDLVRDQPGAHPQLEAAIEQAQSSTREYAVWTGSRHDKDAA